MWYSDIYRRHLCDMHIDDWSDDFLSDFSPEEYVENLVTAGIKSAMIYFQSHAGLCYWPTKSGVMHKAFEKDPEKMKRLVDLCHKRGIRVMGYYSLIYNTREHDRHPQWRHLAEDGRSNRIAGTEEKSNMDSDSFSLKSRYGHLCPNNAEYRAFLKTQIEEMITYFAPDGMFFDMPFWPGTCYCEHCKKRYLAETGKNIPAGGADPFSSEVTELIGVKYRWMGEFIQYVTDCVKAIAPDMPVEHNFAQSVAGRRDCGCGEEVAAACDFVGGDLYGDLYVQSFTCKSMRSLSKNQPFEYMFSRCKPNLRSHTLSKTDGQIKTSVAVTMAHHGATLVIDAIDPVGTMDKRFYRRLGQQFSFEERYEPYLTGTPRCDVGVFYGIRSRNVDPKDTVNSKSGSIGAVTAMIKNHIMCDVTGARPFENYKYVIASLPTDAEPAADRLIKYVENGGMLYFSGTRNKKLLETLLGAAAGKPLNYGMVYAAPAEGLEEVFCGFNKKYPVPFDHIITPAKGIKDARTLAYVTLPYTDLANPGFASIHCDPPGVYTDIPAAVLKNYGKGKVLWSAVPFETAPYDEYGDILVSLIKHFFGVSSSVVTDAPDNVEITVFDEENRSTVNCVVLDGGNKPHPVFPFGISVKTVKAPRAVKLLPYGTDVPFTFKDGFASFNARALDVFDMYLIEY